MRQITCPHCNKKFSPKCCVCGKDIDADNIITDTNRKAYCSTKCFAEKQRWIRERTKDVRSDTVPKQMHKRR
jgi:hypothetical protein